MHGVTNPVERRPTLTASGLRARLHRYRSPATRAPAISFPAKKHRPVLLPRALAALSLTLVTCAAPLRAQQTQQGWQPSGATGEAAFLGFNVLAGALTAGVSAKLRGRDFSDAAVRGALGGAVVYGGKRVVVTEMTASGLLGRQVAAVGTSVVRNAGDGRPMFERVILPLVLLRLHVNVPQTRIEAARFNLAELATLVWAATRDELVFDWRATMESGAPVFDSLHRIRSRSDDAAGVMDNGIILVAPGTVRERVIAHERVHVLQHDFFGTVVAAPIESWLLQRIPHGRAVDRLLEPGLIRSFTGPLYPMYEAEAQFLHWRR